MQSKYCCSLPLLGVCEATPEADVSDAKCYATQASCEQQCQSAPREIIDLIGSFTSLNLPNNGKVGNPAIVLPAVIIPTETRPVESTTQKQREVKDVKDFKGSNGQLLTVTTETNQTKGINPVFDLQNILEAVFDLGLDDINEFEEWREALFDRIRNLKNSGIHIRIQQLRNLLRLCFQVLNYLSDNNMKEGLEDNGQSHDDLLEPILAGFISLFQPFRMQIFDAHNTEDILNTFFLIPR